MKPHIHAKASARKYGGVMEDYMPIHEFMDCSKQIIADVRHRLFFHSAFGIYIVEKVFGPLITLANGKQVSVRDIAEDHVIQDMGRIPAASEWFDAMEIQAWMGGPVSKKNLFRFDNGETQVENYVD